MAQENTEDTIVSPFSEQAWTNAPTTSKEVILPENEGDSIIEDVVKDPVIADKDAEIKEENPTSDHPNDPLKIPAATPPPIQDLPEEKKKAPEATIDIKKWLSEKEDEIYNVLNQKQTLKNIDKLPHADVIKLALKNENKEYTKDDIEDLFNEKFAVPERPEQKLDELDDDFLERENKYKEQLSKWERKVEREAKSAKTSLQKQIQELALPDIPQVTFEPQEPTKEELAAIEKQQETFLQTVNGSLSNFSSYNTTFKDQEVEIPITVGVTNKEKEDLKPLLNSLNTDLPQFFQQLNWLDKDGNLNTDKVVNDLHLIQNKGSVIPKLVNEAGNKRVAEERKRQKNIDFSGQQRRGRLDPTAREEAEKKVSGFFAAT